MKDNTIYKIIKCTKCGADFTIEKHVRRKTCSDKCMKYKTPEELKKLSDNRKKYLKENPDKHHWKNKDKFKSVPCEHLKTFLKSKNIIFVEEYTPLKTNAYSIDIAFPDIKVGIEVNGNQHYNKDKTLATYYQERHEKIEESGWILYEIHYSKVFNETFIEELLLKINIREQISYDFYIKKDKSEFVGPPKPNKNIVKKQNKKKQLNKTEIKYINDLLILKALKSSNINFFKFGWVIYASKIIGISTQAVNKFLKRMDPDFYKTCYIKATFVGPPTPNTDQIRKSEKYTKLKLLKESNLDFTNKSWSKDAANIIGVKGNRVRSWIKNEDLDYFNFIKEKEAR